MSGGHLDPIVPKRSAGLLAGGTKWPVTPALAAGKPIYQYWTAGSNSSQSWPQLTESQTKSRDLLPCLPKPQSDTGLSGPPTDSRSQLTMVYWRSREERCTKWSDQRKFPRKKRTAHRTRVSATLSHASGKTTVHTYNVTCARSRTSDFTAFLSKWHIQPTDWQRLECFRDYHYLYPQYRLDDLSPSSFMHPFPPLTTRPFKSSRNDRSHRLSATRHARC